MRRFLSLFFYVIIAFSFYSCADNSASPIRNVRFDPELLNRSQLTISGPASNHFTILNNTKQFLGTVYPKQVVAGFRNDLSLTEQQDFLESLGFVKSMGRPFTAGSDILHTLELVDGLNSAQVEQAIRELKKRPEIVYAAPSFLKGTQLMGVSNELTVQLNSKEELKELEHLLNLANASVLKTITENTYLVQVDKNSKGNALELANYLSTQKGIALAEPGFLTSAL